MSENPMYHGEDEEDASSSTTGRERSHVWDYFHKLPLGPDGKQKAKCTSCGTLIKAEFGTTNMKRHIPKCFNIDESTPPQKRIRLDQSIYREKLAISIIKHGYPFSYVDCALVYRRTYERLQLVDKDFTTCPTHVEWTRIESIKNFLEPFYSITKLFSGSSYPTSNLYFYNVWRIQRCIQEEMNNPDPVMSKMAHEMKVKFDKYWENYSMVLSFAIILDPRYKVKMVEYCFNKLGIKDTLLKVKVDTVVNGLRKLYKEYEISSNVLHDSAQGGGSSFDKGVIDDLDGFDSYQSNFSDPENEKSQLDQYLIEPSLDRKVDINILHYWRENQGRYPQLALMARDILSIPITTVASESSFSIGGQIINKYRSSLLSKNAEALLCTRDWLFDLEDDDDEVEEELIEDIEAFIPAL